MTEANIAIGFFIGAAIAFALDSIFELALIIRLRRQK